MREQKIGAYIAQKRRERGLTQDELGEKLGVTGKAVSKWERGLSMPPIETVNSIASVLLCSAESILNAQDPSILSSERGCDMINNVNINDKSNNVYTISLNDCGYEVSPLLFGGNLEHSRSAISRGLSAQMLRNRKFAGMPNSFRGNADEWFVIGEKTFAMVGSDQTFSGNVNIDRSMERYTRHSPLGYHMRRRFECNSQLLQSFDDNISGIGQHGIYIKAREKYEFRIVMRTFYAVKLNVSLTDHNGNVMYAETSVNADSDTWNTYTVFLTPSTTDHDADLRITFSEKARIHIGAISLMPEDNFHGMRKDVVSHLKEMNIKMLRWPGGNFAGEYNWFDGLLPCDMRAPLESYILHLTQPHTLGYDFHEMNTDDFIALCREIGAEPSITLNLTWNTPEENAAWVEYCNGDEKTKYGKMRMERGYTQPYNVKYWSLGNEAGYGHMEGDNTPKGYRRIAEENAKALLNTNPTLILCSSGYHPNLEWGHDANNKLSHLAPMAALHNYVNFPTYSFDRDCKDEYENCLGGVEACRKKIHEMREYLSDEVSIAFDEWNCWYSWYRPHDTFAGVFAAKMFHMFIAEQKISNVPVSAMYQPVNEGCISVLPHRSILTPMGKAFSIMAEHSNGKVLHISDTAAVSEKDGTLTITLINDSYDTEKTFCMETNANADGIQLSADKIGPYTEFIEKNISIKNKDGVISINTLPLSITALNIKT